MTTCNYCGRESEAQTSRCESCGMPVGYPPGDPIRKSFGRLSPAAQKWVRRLIVLTMKINGDFRTNGFGDYHGTNVSLMFIPDGKAKGKIRASFFLNFFY